MDLRSLSPRRAASKAVAYQLLHPGTGEPLEADGKPVTMDILGRDCQALKDKSKEIEQRRAKGEEISPEQGGAELLACLVAGWSGIGLGSAEPLPYSPENAVRLMLDPDADWIVEQIRPFSANRRNYLGNL